MENEKLIAKTRKQLSKLGYSEEKINEFLANLEKEDEEEPKETGKDAENAPKTEENVPNSTPLAQEKIVDITASETTDNEEIKEDNVVDYEQKYNDLKAYVDNALKGINEKFDGLEAKTNKSYEMLDALGTEEKPKDAEEEKEDKVAKMFGGFSSESFPKKEETTRDSVQSQFEKKKER